MLAGSRHPLRHFNRDLKREIDPLVLPLRKKCVAPLSVFLRPNRISVHCIQCRDGLDPQRDGNRIAPKQILFDARFEQGFPRSPGDLAPLRVPPVELGKGIIHGLGAAIEIALHGRFGETLQYIFDKGLLIRPAFASGDDVEGDTDRIL